MTLEEIMPKPFSISCIISTYNDSRYVEKKVQEILSQSIFDEVEFLFIETNSPERERDIISPYCEKYDNIRLLTTEHRLKLYEAWNLGWESASADLICYSNMDDAMHPMCLEVVRNKMLKSPKTELCTVMVARQEQNSPGEWDSFNPERLKQLKIERTPGPFSAWRKDLSKKMGMFSTKFKINGDNEFYSRSSKYKIRTAIIPKVLYLYTFEKPGALSYNKDAMAQEHRFAKEQGITLSWNSSLQKKIWLLRKSFPLFHRYYLMSEKL